MAMEKKHDSSHLVDGVPGFAGGDCPLQDAGAGSIGAGSLEADGLITPTDCWSANNRQGGEVAVEVGYGTKAVVAVQNPQRRFNDMATVPFVLGDTQKVSYALNAVDADGNVAALPAGDTVSVVSADPTIAQVVPDASPAAGSVASGFILGQSKLGTTQVTATAIGSDGTTPDPSLAPAVQAIQTVAGAAASMGFTLGTPVSQ
jgi:hypothetical protein